DGGNIPGVIVGAIDRDGVGAEAAPGYALSWGGNIGALADMLADYPGYTTHDIYRDFPQFKQTFTAGWRIAVLGFATPNIGDSGACGTTGLVGCDPNFIARGYRYLKDPAVALAAYRANRNSAEGLGRNIFDADPDRIPREIEAIANRAVGSPDSTGHNMAGYGLASIEFGSGRDGKAIWCYYGRNGGHGHPDRLNIGVYAFGLCMIPDLGYPEFAARWPKRAEWTDNTICHNTVVVDQQRQNITWVGQPRFFKQLPGVGAFEISSPNVYPQTREYARTVVFVRTPDGNAYAVDVFRVQGGTDHILSFHGVPGEVQATGLRLDRQAKGTYAGPDVPFAAHIGGPRMGYSYLYDVERDADPPNAFSLDWKAQEGYRGVKAHDDVHVRWHVFAQCDDVALASGDPPQNKRGNPRRLRYALLHRAGDDLASEYVSVIEPYRDAPFIADLKLLTPPADDAASPVGLRIELSDGAADYVLYHPAGGSIRVDDGPSLDGTLGFVRVRDGAVQKAALLGGAALSIGTFVVKADAPAYRGRVVRMDRDMKADGRIWVDAALPTDGSLVGEQIVIENDGARNACYDIRAVERDGDLTMISCGDVSFIRGYKDPKDPDAGFVYNFEVGAAFTVPNHVYVQRTADGTYESVATCSASVSSR
ncbi:MAG: heparinase II/III family protein, partial [Armatimonadota bacterium]